MGDVKMPNPLEAWVSDRPRGSGSKEAISGSIIVSGYDDGENGVFDP
jgi:hypothetical protein